MIKFILTKAFFFLVIIFFIIFKNRKKYKQISKKDLKSEY
jgi:preprotein translocase subunit SecG